MPVALLRVVGVCDERAGRAAVALADFVPRAGVAVISNCVRGSDSLSLPAAVVETSLVSSPRTSSASGR